jgi:hypothetical protein
MAVMYFVFSLREGDILNLEKATHCWDTASALVLSRIDNATKWYSVRRFPVAHSYAIGERVNIVVDVPDRDYANIQILEVAPASENIFSRYGEDVWVDTVAVE